MRAVPFFVIAVVSIAGANAHAQALVFDHLQCFQIKSAPGTPVPSTLTADLRPEQDPPFALAPGCKVKTKPRLLCIDVAKENVQPPGWTLPVSGETTRDYLCYDVKCPPPTGGLAGDVVTDQFGEHVVTTRASRTLCVPAIRGRAPRATAAPCNDAGAGQCSDTCPGNYRCRFVPAGFDLIGSPVIPIDIPGTNDCRCVPPEVSCGDAAPAVCAVAGPLLCASAAEECALHGASACSCQLRDACGSVQCPVGTVCCNPLMSICTPPGMACVQ